MKAYDLLVQAETGLASITGHPAGPGRVGRFRVRYRVRHGSPCRRARGADRAGAHGAGASGLKVSLFDGMADWMNVPLLYYEGTGRAPARVGLAHPSITPYGAFDTADGAAVLISIQSEREWQGFCTHFLLEPALPQRAGYETNTIRTANRTMVDGHVAGVFAALTRDEAAARLRTAGTAFGFVNDVEGLARHPSLRRTVVQTEAGPASIVAPPVLDSAGPRALGAVPAIGEHTAAIHAEFAGTL